MKIHLPLALVGLAISFASPTVAQQTNTLDPQIIEQLNASSKKIDEAFNNGDAAAMAALFTDDAVLVTDRGPIYGREAIEEYHAGLFMQFHFSNHLGKRDQYSPHIIGTAGNEVWSIGQWNTTMQGKNPGDPIQLKGAIGRRLVFVRAILGRIG
jgi:ketosteroid isomerase-like protein